MKREFLTELGLEKETIDKIMAEHGKTISIEKQAHESAVNDLQEKLTEATEAITKASESNESIEKIQQELEDYKTKYEEVNTTLESERKLLKIKEALTAEGGQDLDYLMYKLGEVEDIEKLDELVSNLKESLPAHFGTEEAKQEQQISDYEVIGNKIDKVETTKTYSQEELGNLSASEINENWEVISQALSN